MHSQKIALCHKALNLVIVSPLKLYTKEFSNICAHQMPYPRTVEAFVSVVHNKQLKHCLYFCFCFHGSPYVPIGFPLWYIYYTILLEVCQEVFEIFFKNFFKSCSSNSIYHSCFVIPTYSLTDLNNFGALSRMCWASWHFAP